MSAIPEDRWELAKVLHEARNRECWGPHYSVYRQEWPGDEVTRHNHGHHPAPCVDVALAQAKAALAHLNVADLHDEIQSLERQVEEWAQGED